MKEKLKLNLKSNRGFTLQDLAIAIIAIILFAGMIGNIYLSILNLKTESKLDAVAGVYAMQVLEYIDEISYDEVINGMEDTCRTKLNIPSNMTLQINIINYEPEENSQDLIKNVEVTIKYPFKGKTKQLIMENIKVKEK
ncbi:MAG: hypothetical protein IJ777_00690 [Clostridia bacterium]|nr:hypothetical protein [Clostridia bacterium]